MEFILDNGEDGESLKAGRQVEHEHVIVVHQLGGRVLLLVGQHGQLFLCEVQRRAVIGTGAAKQENLTHKKTLKKNKQKMCYKIFHLVADPDQGLPPPRVGAEAWWREEAPGPCLGVQTPQIILMLFCSSIES